MLGSGESCGCHRGRQPPHRKGWSRGKEFLNVTLLLPSRLLTSPPTGQTLQDTREQGSLIPVWVRHVSQTTTGEGKGDREGRTEEVRAESIVSCLLIPPPQQSYEVDFVIFLLYNVQRAIVIFPKSYS